MVTGVAAGASSFAGTSGAGVGAGAGAAAGAAVLVAGVSVALSETASDSEDFFLRRRKSFLKPFFSWSNASGAKDSTVR